MTSRAASFAIFISWLAASAVGPGGCTSLPRVPADAGNGDRPDAPASLDGASPDGRSDVAGTGGGGGRDASDGGGGSSPGDGGPGGATAGSGGVSGGGRGGGTAGTGGGAAGAGGAGGRGGSSGGAGGRGGGTAGTGGSGAGGRGGGTAGTGGVGAGGGSAPNGMTCTRGSDCMSALCVDGRCCNASCSGQCEACDVPSLEGICAPVPPGPPHGTRALCAGSGACAGQCGGSVRTACTYPSAITSCRVQSCNGNTVTRAAGCDGLGACSPVAMMTCAQGCSGNDCLGACTADTQCAAAGQGRNFCDAGTCTERMPNGRGCSAGTDCTSGHCVDGYCCDSACAAQCGSCKEPSLLGTCVTVVGAPRTGGTPARSACGGAGVCQGQCDGFAASCQYPMSGTACGSVSCAGGTLTPVGGCNGAGACQQTPGPCATAYCSTATSCGSCPAGDTCGTGQWCFSGTCRPKLTNGQACTVAGECSSGFCVGNGQGASFCCPSACTGNSVCYQGACCTLNTACDPTSCRTGTCQRGCGLPDLQRNCGCTSTGCCGNQCCVSGFCNGTSCTAMTTCSP